MSRITIRRARPDDADAIAAFTDDTWGDRHEDYIPRVFAEWARTDGDGQRTLVATLTRESAEDVTEAGAVRSETLVDGDGTGAAAAGDPEAVVGCIQGVLLSEWEAWAQGIRVNPTVRGVGVGTRLTEAVLDWAREAGATVCRNMVFSWNAAGLGQSRAVGFDPTTEFRFARPEPDPDAAAAALDDPDPDGAWAFWQNCDARDHLRGLALDPAESWACSELTRDRMATAAAEGRLIAVGDDGITGYAIRTRIEERETDDDVERHAVYGVAAWRDTEAAGTLYDAIARDAAERDADATRVVIPETVGHVSDTAANRIAVDGEPDFVMSAALTDRLLDASE
ncbi:N-acetyltransferase family protein [Halorubrum sp. DTA98]|uniref:GNAT family N-acetyltransferase n=1 Tax=Halorubrum sp. DTA98 TaxID=3402163 RepID=UPI003AABCB57